MDGARAFQEGRGERKRGRMMNVLAWKLRAGDHIYGASGGDVQRVALIEDRVTITLVGGSEFSVWSDQKITIVR